jgi:thymidylate kinase
MFKRQEQRSFPVTDPHARPPRSLPVSVLKLLYWVVDYWFGYLAVIRPALLSSTLVLFDRYYDDLLVDPKRYRLPVSSLHFARLLARLVPRPDLYVVLDVPAELVQQRKAEVSCAESRRQRIAYLQMFRSLPNALIIDAAEPVDNVTRQMRSIILHTLATRAQDPTGVSLIVRA